MNRLVAVFALNILLAGVAAAQNAATVAAPEAIVQEGVPPVPAALAETAGRYAETRAARRLAPAAPRDADWHPVRRTLIKPTW